MPTYNYQCESCKCVIQVFQSMNDKPLEKLDCKKCEKIKKVKRIIKGGSGMIFKGSGFYLTDYTGYGKPPKDSKAKQNVKENNDNKNKD